MQPNEHMRDRNLEHLRVRSRPVPLCYSRDGADQASTETESGTALSAVLSAVTCVALFVVVYGGWAH